MILTRFTQLLLVVATIVAIAPDFAQARAGGGRSVGSRGSNTFQSVPHAAPIDRTTTSKPATTGQNSYNPSQPSGFPGSRPSFFGSIAGGFLGAGLFGMLFGHSFMGEGGGGMIGGLFQTLMIGGLIYYLYNRFKGRGFPSASNFMPISNNAATGNYTGISGSGYTSPTSFGAGNVSAPVNTQTITVTEADKTEFEQLLGKIQHCWSEGDMARLRQFVTPEMSQYFSEELSANSSRGVANKVEQVQLVDAGVVEAWHEYDLDYATAQMKWSALDYMVKLDRSPSDADYVSSGSNTAPDTAEEIWTFVRASGGRWLLSAIQQVQA